VTDEITYDGGNPDALRDFVFSKVGPGRLNYVWGGMAWSVSLATTIEGGYRLQTVNIGDRIRWDGVDIRRDAVVPPQSDS